VQLAEDIRVCPKGREGVCPWYDAFIWKDRVLRGDFAEYQGVEVLRVDFGHGICTDVDID
jgi:hypothetical protein